MNDPKEEVVEESKNELEVIRKKEVREDLHRRVDSPYNHVIIMATDAVETCKEVEMLLADLRNVAMNMEGEEKTELEQEIHAMEISWSRLYSGVMFIVNDWDGWVSISKDSHLSLFWIHPQSGYHGGFIFHPHYKDGRERRYASHPLYKDGQKFEIGRWSIHT